MFKTNSQAVEFIESLAKLSDQESYLAVPFTALSLCAAKAPAQIKVGAQNMHDAVEGAYTGEISLSMLQSAGAEFVLLGHSERRHVFAESQDLIRRKLERAVSENFEVILCIGETIEQREAGETESVLREQLETALKGLDPTDLNLLRVAYEPVWAIGTGKTATPEIAQTAHAFCRKVLAELFSEDFAQALPILYGGSVKPENAETLLEEEDIDGALIGGASLKVDSFAKILSFTAQNTRV